MLAIVLALGASLSWGSGDFLGGLTTRRASLWAVIVGSQAVGLVDATLVVVLAGIAAGRAPQRRATRRRRLRRRRMRPFAELELRGPA